MKRAIVSLTLLYGCASPPPLPAPRVVPLPPPVAPAPPPAPVWPAASYVVEPVSGLGLFPEEQRAAQQIIARWAMARGITVTPVDAIEARLDNHGRGLAADGQRCGKPLYRTEARTRYASELGIVGSISSSVYCGDEGCFLSVRHVEGIGREAKTGRRWITPFEAEVGLEALAARLTIESDADGRGGLLGVLGDLAKGGKVEARPERLVVRAWRARADEDRKELTVTLSDPAVVQQCLPPDGSTTVVVGIGGDGKPNRCAPTSHRRDPARCVCEALTSQVGLGLPANARISVSARHESGDTISADGKHVVRAYAQTYIKRDPEDAMRRLPSVSHASIESWDPPRSASIERCFVERAENASFSVLVDTFFGERGEVRSVAIHKGEELLSPSEVACLKQTFRGATVPCPGAPRTGARASVGVDVKTIGEPRPSLSDMLGKPPEGVLPTKPKKD